MKKLLHFTLMVIGAAIPMTFISCGDDEDDGVDKKPSQKSYTFLFNDETYYYGRIDEMDITTIHCFYELNMDYYELDNDWCSFYINAQNAPYISAEELFDEDGNMLEPDYNTYIEGHFTFKKFDPKTIKKGDELEIIQNVNSYRKDSDDPKYLFDFDNNLKLIDEKSNQMKQYSWRGPAKGKIKFVSYTDHPDGYFKLITLEFDNVTFEVYQGYDYISHPYKAKTVTINGKISFSSSVIG